MHQTEAEPVSPVRVFVSYSSHDAAAANAVAAALEAQGIACWIAPRDVPLGMRYGAAIIDGINACSALILLLSRHANASPQVLAEVERAVSKGLPILTVRLEAVALDKSLEYFLSSFHWIDAVSPPLDSYLDRLVEAVRGRITTGSAVSARRSQAAIPSQAVRTPNNLPQQVTSFIGREKEMVEITALLEKTRLLTLTGSGGSGKTRLALHVAKDQAMADGVWLVELAPLADPALVAQSVAEIFEVSEIVGTPLMKTLAEALNEKCVLLILDNCEHMLSACAVLAAELLRSCPGVQILASSREALGVPGEQVYRVPSLSLPDLGESPSAAMLAMYEAARLFAERAQAVRPDFAVTDANAGAVAQICRHLDGIPLALELAATRVRSLSVEEVDARLDHRFRLLTGGSKTLLPRQQTLRALIDWSYNLLTDQEKTLLIRLSVFAGGWDLTAAETVGAGESIEDFEVLDVLTALSDKSLVIVESVGEGTRYRLLETIRQYALERLEAEGDVAESARERHAAWCLSLVETTVPMLRGPEQKNGLMRLDTEHDNLRAALTWGLESVVSCALEGGWRLAGELTDFWYIRGYLSEGRRWLARVLSSAEHPSVAPDIRFKVLRGAGMLAAIQGDYAASQTLSEEALHAARESGDQKNVARILGDLGSLFFVQGDYAIAQDWYEQSLAVRREITDDKGLASLLCNLGFVANRLGDPLKAQERLHEALALFERVGDYRQMGMALSGLGSVATDQGNHSAAKALYLQALERFQEVGNARESATTQGNLGVVAFRQGDFLESQSMLEQSIASLRDLGDKRNLSAYLCSLGLTFTSQGKLDEARSVLEESLILTLEREVAETDANLLQAFADMALAQRQPERAAQLLGAADAVFKGIGVYRTSVNRVADEQTIAAVRAMLGDDAFAAAFAAGRAMTRDQYFHYARDGGTSSA